MRIARFRPVGREHFTVIVWFNVIAVCAALNYCIERPQECEGPDSECSSTVPCHHGECDQTGQLCLCQGCWAGKNCNQYVDEHPPSFLTTDQYVSVAPDDSGVLFNVTAFDADNELSCQQSIGECPCGAVRYEFIIGHDEWLFDLDVDTGDVSLKGTLTPGMQYVVMIGGKSAEPTNSTSTRLLKNQISSQDDVLKVTIQVRNEDDQTETVWHRSKRAAETSFSNQTIFTFSQVAPIASTTHVAVGDKKSFMMEIEVPSGVSMDLNVEIFTVDPESKHTAFAICSLKTEVGSQLQPASIGATQAEFVSSEEYPQFNDRILLDFGAVSAVDGADETDRKITLNFTTFLLNNSPYVVDGSNYSVVVGATYDNDAYVWIGQAPFTAVIPAAQDDNSFPSEVSLEGDNVLSVAGYAEYTIKAYSTNPMARYQVDVFVVEGLPDTYSMGPIVMASLGDNYPCTRENLLVYSFDLGASNSGRTAKSSTLKTEEIINCDDSGRGTSNNPANEMLFKFLVYAPDVDGQVDNYIQLSATVMINTKTIWTNMIEVSIEPKKVDTAGTPTMFIEQISVVGPPQSTVNIRVDIVIPEKTYTEVALEVLAPEAPVDPAPLSVCGYRTSGGVNIPYTPKNLDPELTPRIASGKLNDKMVANFGRIWSADLVKGNVSASTMTVSVFVRIEDASADEQSVLIKLSSADGTSEYGRDTVTVKVAGAMPDEKATDIDFRITDVLNDSTLAVQGQTAMQVSIFFKAEMLVNSMSLEVMSALQNESVKARVCRAEVSFIGVDIPCVNKQTLNKNVAYLTRNAELDVYDTATIDLGSVCISNLANNSADDKMVMSFAVELFAQPEAIDGALYTLYGGIKVGNEMVWTGAITYAIQTTATAVFHGDETPSVQIIDRWETTSPIPGSTTVLYIQLKIPPQSRAAYVLTIWTTIETEKMGICAIRLSYVGHNFPCVNANPNPQPGNDSSRVSFIRINYDERDDTLGAYAKAIVDFGLISNLGSGPFNTMSMDDDNSITMAIALKLDKNAADVLRLHYDLMYTSLDSEILGTRYIRPEESQLPPTVTTKPNMTFGISADSKSDIDVRLTKILVLRFQLVEGMSSPMTVKFQNPDPAAKDFGFCSASVTKVSSNSPCLNSTTVFATSEDPNPSNCMSTLVMDLGDVCHTPLDADPEQNWITIEVGMNIIDPTLTGLVTAKATLIVDSTEYDADPLALPITSSTPITSSPKNVTLTPLINGSVSMYIGVPKWIDLNVTIPKDSLFTMSMTALGASAASRAIITVTAIKVSTAGVNVACIRNATERNSKLSNSDAIKTTQKDMASIDFGLVLNTGFTFRRGYHQDFDDQVTISVEAVMTDHPNADDGAEFPLTFIVETESGIYSVNQTLTVVRNGTEKPELTVVAEVIDSKLFKRLDTVSVRILVSHKKTSSAEPTDADVRLYLPSYISYTSNSVLSNMTVVESTGASDYPILQINDPFLFGDICEINFTLTVDPLNKRGFDAETIDIVSLGRIMAHVRQRTVAGNLYPATATDYLYAADIFYVSYRIASEPCKRPLGMEDKRITDCQLSASTATDENHGPRNARFNGASGIVWQPALRNNGYLDYLQVDFGNRTRVSQIAFQKDSCCRAPTSIAIQQSDGGGALQWKDLQMVFTVTYVGNIGTVELEEPVDSRMIRIEIDNADEPENKDTKYVGVRVEFYGCTVGSAVSPTVDICASTPRTITSTDVMRYRHFSVAMQNNAVFACDLKTETLDLQCFCSVDGSKWTKLPQYVNIVLGYDESDGRTYAMDSKNTTLISSDDCSKWLASTRQALDDARASGRFTESSVVAGFTKDNPSMVKVIGKWKATYEGLYLDNTKKLGWSL